MIENGQIYWAKDIPTVSGASDSIVYKNRPVLITNCEKALRYSNISTVIPLTSKIEKLNFIPSHILIKGLLRDSVLLPEQLTTIPQSSIIGNPICKLDDDTMRLVKQAVNQQLGFAV